MPEKALVKLEFPLDGRHDRFGYQKQPPMTTPIARNVWPNARFRSRGGSRPGFCRANDYDFGDSILGLSQVSYIPSASSRIRTSLAVLNPQGFFRIDDDNSITGPISLPTTGSEIISMADRSQKLYIANHSIVQAESAGLYQPAIYDPLAHTITTWTATAGTVPVGCNAICLFRDRMVLAGGTTDPYGVFMSRQGDPLDWDYSEQDAGAAVDLSLSPAGQMPDTVTSLTAHADNCLILGCPTSLWMLVGDPGPAGGGQLVNLSSTIGVVDRHSWCSTPDGLFIFLSADGLYMLPAGCAATGNPISISREKLPSELLGINRASISTGKIVSLAYDVRWRGVHIFVTDRTSANEDDGNLHWFFDWERKAFWPVQYRFAGFDPWTSVSWKNMTTSESVVITGCRDGCLRKYLSTATVDDEDHATRATFDSYVCLGPIAEGPEMANAVRLDELDIILGEDSERVQWELYSGDSAENVITNVENEEELASGIATAGRGNRFFPRIGGAAILLRLASTAYWTFESASALVSRLGRVRV